jgi:uncharacterized cupredoxin-like copper-binding protein
MIKPLPTAMWALAVPALAFSLIAHAVKPQVVEITLLDASADPSISGMVMKLDTTKVKAGPVLLQAVNQSKSLVHEVLVVPALPEGTKLPYDVRKDTVVEKRAHSLGEIAELEPGGHGKLSLNLKAGKYLLLCNQPGHYKSGMSTELVVEK